MIGRWVLPLVILSVQAIGTQAQTVQRAELAYRYVRGTSTIEQSRIVGELRVSAGTENFQVVIDMAMLLRRRVVAVSPPGEATVVIRLASTSARIVIPGQELFLLQDKEGISTLLNGVPLTPAGEAPKDMTVRIGQDGKASALTSISDDPTDRLMSTALATTLVLPARNVAVGERWTSSMSMLLPQGAGGGIPLSISTESEFRSLQKESERWVATIATTSQAAAQDGSGSQHVSIISRFDTTAGALIDAEGDISVDTKFVEPAAEGSAGNAGRLIGRFRFTTVVLSSSTMPVASDATPTPSAPPPPTVVSAPPFGQSTQLGQAYNGWSLSGGEILRYYGSPSEQACRSDCANNAACQGYTWVKPGGYHPGDPPVCYLMRSYQSANTNRCCIAATRGPFPEQ